MRVVLVLIRGFLEQLRKGYLMPLTTFLKLPDVREEFKQEFVKPKIKVPTEMLAAPRTQRYTMIGTAFDYLLRFYIKQLNPNAIEVPWIAEKVVDKLDFLMSNGPIPGYDTSTGEYHPPLGKTAILTKLVKKEGRMFPQLKQNEQEVDVMGRYYPHFDRDGGPTEIGVVVYDTPIDDCYIFNEKTNELFLFSEAPRKKIKQIIGHAKAVYGEYLLTGVVTDELLKSAICLAQLDPIYREMRIDDNLGVVDSEDIADLRALISQVDENLFLAKEMCLLNPTFGAASRMVNGADADLLIDDIIIDVKTTKNPEFTLDYFLQLIGYYVLFRIGGIDNAPKQPKIERLGIYYARHAELIVIPVSEVVNEVTLESFIKWFKGRARSKSSTFRRSRTD